MEKRELRCGRGARRALGGNVDRDEGWDDRYDREFEDLGNADDRNRRRKLPDTRRADDAVLPATLEVPESSGWLWSSGSAAKRSATKTIHGESRRSICSISSYHEIGGLELIFR
jgi:hypothetical protein